MQAERKKVLSARPFVPFAVLMSDGTRVTVKHPEMALLTKHWLNVTTDDAETTEHRYLLYITRLPRQRQPA